MRSDNDILGKVVETGSNIAGGIAAKTLSEAIFPGASILGEICGPIVSNVFEDVAHRMLSQYENNRIGYVTQKVVTNIGQRIQNGEQPRRDDEFYVRDEYGQSSASKLFEEMLLKCKEEYEAKKLDYYSNFWENICFENGVTYDTANSLISQFASLSYQQIKILMYLNTGVSIPLGKWEKYMFSSDVLTPYYSLYSDSLHLYNVRLAAQSVNDHGGLKIGTPDICISPSGKLMCKLLKMEFRDTEEEEMHKLISSIDTIVDRLMKEANDDGSDRNIPTASPKEIEALLEKQKAEIIEAAKPHFEYQDGSISIGYGSNVSNQDATDSR